MFDKAIGKAKMTVVATLDASNVEDTGFAEEVEGEA